jgi:hypothetical protein
MFEGADDGVGAQGLTGKAGHTQGRQSGDCEAVAGGQRAALI